tara:strand:+ start:483 stop:638 length:156 start_codon:yes stop_codon:yes gene_type:complete
MEIMLTLLAIWSVTFILSYLANSAQASNEIKQLQRVEEERKKKLDQLYGRD